MPLSPVMARNAPRPPIASTFGIRGDDPFWLVAERRSAGATRRAEKVDTPKIGGYDARGATFGIGCVHADLEEDLDDEIMQQSLGNGDVIAHRSFSGSPVAADATTPPRFATGRRAA